MLISKSSFDPSKESKPVAIKTLCDDIASNKITIPIFQTYVRWKLDKSISLLNFQLLGYAAVSPISINIIDDENNFIPQVSFIERHLIEYRPQSIIHSVNDGQQRLTCNYKAYIDHPDFRCIVLDISRGKFVENNERVKKNQIPVGKLYNRDPREFTKYLESHPELQVFRISDLLQRIRNKFLGYYYTVNYAKNLAKKEQMDWFEVLNLAGSRVTAVQIALTEMLIKGADFYKDYAIPLSEKMEQYDLQDLFVFKATEISIPLAMLNPIYESYFERKHSNNFSPIPSDAKPQIYGNLECDDLNSLFQRALQSVDYTLEFIEKNLEFSLERIEEFSFLVGAFGYTQNYDIDDITKTNIIQWVRNVDFTNKGNTERRRIFEELLDVLGNGSKKHEVL